MPRPQITESEKISRDKKGQGEAIMNADKGGIHTCDKNKHAVDSNYYNELTAKSLTGLLPCPPVMAAGDEVA
jgi:hypothetical protein